MEFKPDVKANDSMWGPREWSFDDVEGGYESFKGHISIDRDIHNLVF